MQNLTQEIQSSFEAISLILVFVVILFDLRYPRIFSDIQKEIPEGEHAKRQHRKKLQQSLLFNSGPLILINGVASYLFLPLFVRVVRVSHFEPWGFNFIYSSFIFITLVVLLFFLWSGYLAILLAIQIWRSR